MRVAGSKEGDLNDRRDTRVGGKEEEEGTGKELRLEKGLLHFLSVQEGSREELRSSLGQRLPLERGKGTPA